jgi:transposase-like protein
MDPSRTEAMKQRLLRGDSTVAVAADYGLTRARISQIAQAHGFSLQQLRRNKTADVVRETAALGKAGHDLKEIGARIGLRPETVRKYLKTAGVKAKIKPKYVRTFDPAKVEELRERLHRGEPIGSIVMRFGVAKDTISRLARYYGFPRRVRRRNDPVYKDAVRQRLASGEKITAIAAHFGVTPGAIRQFVRRHGLLACR